MNLSAFQEHMAFSYFFATYGWAYFWKPFLHLARETDLAPNASRMCSLALAYGHMGISKGDKRLKSTGLELYGKTLREVQSSLSKGVEARSELARLCVPVVILGMYSVCLFHAVPPITPYHMSTCLRRVFRSIDPHAPVSQPSEMDFKVADTFTHVVRHRPGPPPDTQYRRGSDTQALRTRVLPR
jgi:hypothetical protein